MPLLAPRSSLLAPEHRSEVRLFGTPKLLGYGTGFIRSRGYRMRLPLWVYLESRVMGLAPATRMIDLDDKAGKMPAGLWTGQPYRRLPASPGGSTAFSCFLTSINRAALNSGILDPVLVCQQPLDLVQLPLQFL